jgi:hypothetical protein
MSWQENVDDACTHPRHNYPERGSQLDQQADSASVCS